MKGIIVINIFYCEEVMEKKKKSKQRGKMALLSYQHTARVELNSEGYLFSQLTELYPKSSVKKARVDNFFLKLFLELLKKVSTSFLVKKVTN